MSQLSDRLETIPMTLVAEYRGFVEGEWPHFAWTVSLEYQGRKYSSPYRTGIGHAKPRLGCNRVSGGISTPRGNMKELAACRAGYLKPTPPGLADVLSCLMSDACGAEDTFEGWCGDFGYDTDSRKALATYLACQETRGALIAFLGHGLFDELSRLEH